MRPSEESPPSSNRRIRHANRPSLHREGLEVHDAPARHANDRRIWPNLRDAFPHPYGLANAEAFIAMATTMSPITFFAVAVGDEAVGGIGYTLHQDVERVSALVVRDYDAAIRFFVDVLQFQLVEDMPSLTNDRQPNRTGDSWFSWSWDLLGPAPTR